MTAAPDTSGQAAAFFDVDGTLARTTIVHYYVYFRRRRMGKLTGALWQGLFLLKCVYYLILDKIDRSRLNVVFYRSYRGLPVREIKELMPDCHREILHARRFVEVADAVRWHRAAGRRVVLVTGSLDFIIAPLAEELQVDDVVAPALVERDGRFTGELTGPPIGDGEKARRMRAYAEEHAVDLAQSFAYGDSTADLPMLETVGRPHVVNPDRKLEAVARERGWPVLRWRCAAAQGDLC